MSGERLILTPGGKRLLNAAGKQMLNLPGAAGCCGPTPGEECTLCSGTTPLTRVATFVDVVLCPCYTVTNYSFRPSLLAGSINAAHELTQNSANPCQWVATTGTVRHLHYPYTDCSGASDYHNDYEITTLVEFVILFGHTHRRVRMGHPGGAGWLFWSDETLGAAPTCLAPFDVANELVIGDCGAGVNEWGYDGNVSVE